MSPDVPVEKRKLPLAALAIAGAVALIGLAVLIKVVGWPTVVQEGRRLWTMVFEVLAGAGPGVFFAAMAVLPVAGVPMSPFALSAGPLFGARLGTPVILLLGLAAITFNLTVTYWLARRWLRPVLAGIVTALWLTGTTINIQSAMGAIMAVGVAVANAILLVTFAEKSRVVSADPLAAAVEGGRSRLRPILMTSCAMIAGMLPLALGLGEGGDQTAPLGRSVVGGLIAATLATLLVLPAFFAILGSRRVRSPSLDPDDPASEHHVAARRSR